MSSIHSIAVRTVVTAFLFIPFAFAQSVSTTQPLSTVAHEKKDAKSKSVKAAKVFTNDDLTSRSAEPSARSTSSPRAFVQESEGEKREPANHSLATTNVVDRQKGASPDVIVIPAGTELKIDVSQHKTVAPVRVGFATPIPALSQVTVQLTRSYVSLLFPSLSYPSYTPNPNVDYTEYATITAVNVEGKTYQMQTDSVPLWRGGTNSDVTFVLTEALEMLR